MLIGYSQRIQPGFWWLVHSAPGCLHKLMERLSEGKLTRVVVVLMVVVVARMGWVELFSSKQGKVSGWWWVASAIK